MADVAETREDNSLDSNTEKDGGENNPAVRKELAKNIDEASAKKLQNGCFFEFHNHIGIHGHFRSCFQRTLPCSSSS